MNLTLLVDLDDTLLCNSMDTFLPAYLNLLGKYLSTYFPADRMIKELLTATRRMVNNQDPCKTLEQAFDESFYSALGSSKEAMRPVLEAFYGHEFPNLQELTAPNPHAIALIEAALDRGYQIVVATNPLFPAAAINHRLAWAGLPVTEFPFSLITSYENFHFAKPNPAYYAEILAQLGWPDQPALMVGNSLEDDMVPAAAVGLPTYWLNDATENQTDQNPVSGRGNLEGLLDWIDENSAKLQAPTPATPEGLLGILRSTPAALQTIISDMPAQCWQNPPKPGEWNVTQIACHLRDVDREVNLPRLEKFTREENPFLPGIDSDPWAEERSYIDQDGPAALSDFQQARIDMISILNNLSLADWQRTARHAIFGPTRLIELVSFITTHDRTHIQQILQNMCA